MPRCLLLSAEGELLIRSDAATMDTLPTQASQRVLNDDQLQIHDIERDGQTLLVNTLWLPELQRYLMVEVDKETYLTSTRERFLESSCIGLFILLVGLLVLYPLTGTLVRPVVQFQRQLKEITHSLDLTRRVSTDDRAELGDLADQTNELLERLSRAIVAVAKNS